MPSVFLDAAVLFSAALSSTGASRELFHLAQKGHVELVTNEIAVIEANRNLASKNPEAVVLFKILIATPIITVFPKPLIAEVEAAAEYTELKDAPIVAGAINANADYLATFDQRHLINPLEVAQKSGLVIATSGDILARIRGTK